MQTNFQRQFYHLNSLGNEVLSSDGFLSNGLFYQNLFEFIKFYNEIKPLLINEYTNDDLVRNKILSLPELNFKDYDNPFSIKTILYGIGYLVFFPIGIIYMYNKYQYVTSTKLCIREIQSILSSIEFLTKVTN